MELSQDILDKFADAEVTGRSAYIQKGRYTFIVKKIWTKKGFKGSSAGAEYYVKESAALSSDSTPNPMGSTCGFAVNFKNEMAFVNLKQFVCALVGEEDESKKFSKESPEGKAFRAKIIGILRKLAGEEQAGRGYEIKAETLDTVKKNGEPFMAVNYTHLEMSDEQAAANRALLDSLGL